MLRQCLSIPHFRPGYTSFPLGQSVLLSVPEVSSVSRYHLSTSTWKFWKSFSCRITPVSINSAVYSSVRHNVQFCDNVNYCKIIQQH